MTPLEALARLPAIVPPPPTWTDLFGRVNARATIQDVTDAIHGRAGQALAYVATYAAREGYEASGVSPAWGLGDGRFLFLFDPANPAWQAKMATEYADAVRTFGFDGVQIDQFGPRFTLDRADGAPVELNETFAPFLEARSSPRTRRSSSRPRWSRSTPASTRCRPSRPTTR